MFCFKKLVIRVKKSRNPKKYSNPPKKTNPPKKNPKIPKSHQILKKMLLVVWGGFGGVSKDSEAERQSNRETTLKNLLNLVSIQAQNWFAVAKDLMNKVTSCNLLF